MLDPALDIVCDEDALLSETHHTSPCAVHEVHLRPMMLRAAAKDPVKRP